MVEPKGFTRKGYVDAPTGQVHYRETGTGTPLLLLHASPRSSQMFERVYHPLAGAGFRVIGMDTPGFGASDVPDGIPEISDYAGAISYVLDALGIEKTAILGHHTGAGVGCEFAAEHPERVSKLILNGPPLFTKKDLEFFYATYKLKPRELKPDGSHLAAGWPKQIVSDVEGTHRNFVTVWNAGSTSYYGHRAAFAYDMEPRFLALSVPTLIFTNTGDDIYAQAQYAHQLRPDLPYIELLGGNHDIVDHQTDAWVRVVVDYLTS